MFTSLIYLDAGAALTDIIVENSRYKGAIEEISWLTVHIDDLSIQIISIVAYLVITIAIIRTALEILYWTFPNFFDAVENIKKDIAGCKTKSGPRGIFAAIAYYCIPNIKEIIDVDYGLNNDNDKSLHKRTGGASKNAGIALMKVCMYAFLCICLGTLLYNGTYRDFYGKASDVAAYFLDSYVLNKIDRTHLDEFLSQGTDYDFNSGVDDRSKFLDELNKDVYDEIRTYYKDISSSENKQSLGSQVEIQMTNKLQSMASPFKVVQGTVYDLLGRDNFKYSYEVGTAAMKVPDSIAMDTAGKHAQIVYSMPMNGFGYESANFQDGSDTGFVRICINATYKEASGTDGYHSVEIVGGMLKQTTGTTSATTYVAYFPQGSPTTIYADGGSWRQQANTGDNSAPAGVRLYIWSGTDSANIPATGTLKSTTSKYQGVATINSIRLVEMQSIKNANSIIKVTCEGKGSSQTYYEASDLKITASDINAKESSTGTKDSSTSIETTTTATVAKSTK